jgi:predicted esterase
MDVLVCLAARANEPVTRDELLKEVWGEHAVSDEPLTHAIGELRRALHDDRSNPKYIETIPKRGYRLIGAVRLPEPPSSFTAADTQASKRQWSLGGVIAVAAIGIAAFGISEYQERTAERRWAIDEGLPEAQRLVENDHFIEAYAKMLELERIIPEDHRVASLWPEILETGSLTTDPSGANVYYRPYSERNAGWSYLGKTPLEDISLPRGALAYKIDKAGYVSAYIADFNPGQLLGNLTYSFLVRSTVKLSKSVPDGQVFVPPFISSSDFATPSLTGPFFIDEYEVTNQQFKEFVDTGGYEERTFWDGLVFLDEERQLNWEDAVQTFTDSTGRPGPATWELGSYLGGQASWPVSGVSWYEAMAYARFRGKNLPTQYHWRRAAMSPNLAQAIISMSNFDGEGISPVGLYTGLSTFGAYDMAGNVREWVWNERGAQRMILGGSWNDQRYMFTHPNSLPPLDRSAANGFRTVQYLDEGPTERQLAAVVRNERDIASMEPLSDEAYAALITQFDYSRTSLRSGEVIASRESSRGWRHDTVSIESAHVPGGFKVHIYLPLNAKPPFQPVILFPGLYAFQVGIPSESDALLEHPGAHDLDFVIRSGRVLIWPVYHGSYERYESTTGLSNPERVNALRLKIIRWRSDVGEVIDYLEGRPDIAADKIAFLGYSYGGLYAPPVLALEDRIKAAILIAAEVSPWSDRDPLVDNLHYLPRVRQPTLLFSGEYDYVAPLGFQKALYEHLGTPMNDKKHVIFPIEHELPPRSALMTLGVDWLDRYLGPVN